MDQRMEGSGSTRRHLERNQFPIRGDPASRLSSRDADEPGHCPYYLDLTEVDKIMDNLDDQLARITSNSDSKSLHMFSKSFGKLVQKVRSLQATTMHQNSTRMKRHLLQQIAYQRQKRGEIQAKYDQLLQQFQSQSRLDSSRSRPDYKWCKICPIKEQQIKQLLQSIDDLQKALERQQQVSNQIRTRIANQPNGLAQVQSLNHRISQLSSKNEQLARENDQVKSGYKRLNSMLANVNQKLVTTEDNLNKVTSQLEGRLALEARNTQLALQSNQHLANLDIMRRRVAKLEQQNHNLGQRLTDLTNRLQQKQKTMNTWIESMQKRNQNNFSQNIPSGTTKTAFLQQAYNTPSNICQPKNDMVHKVSTLKVPSEHRQRWNRQPGLSKDTGRKDESLGPDGDQVLRMLLLQACSLEEYILTDHNHAIRHE